ncbi:MAG: DUF4363 family protein [Clostridia bacterium]|jgi:hypothetical protein|nr:DUF4363 family protein [Clostridia bacterium]
MVKSVIYTLAALALCIGTFIGVEIYTKKQFKDFENAVDTLYKKVEANTADREDGYAVRTLWADKKSKLHVFVPHNDISYIDYWLSEACGLIYEGEYGLALGKIEVLKEIVKNLPDAYTLKLENIF